MLLGRLVQLCLNRENSNVSQEKRLLHFYEGHRADCLKGLHTVTALHYALTLPPPLFFVELHIIPL